MKGLFNIILNDNSYRYEKIIKSYIESIKYYAVTTHIEPNSIKIYCNDYRAKPHMVCHITNDDVKINKRFPDLMKILREIKIEEINNDK